MRMLLSDEQLLNLSDEQARDLYSQGPAVTTWALLRLQILARKAGETQGASCEAAALSTPSAQIPVYKKPPGKKRSKKRGRKKGHKGSRRNPPAEIDETCEHTLEQCPFCGEPLGAPCDSRSRIIEDIGVDRTVTTEHKINRHSCPNCKKRVEPKVAQALPRSPIGHRVVALTAWLHYGLGQTISQIIEVLSAHFHFPISAGGLSQLWMRVAEKLRPWYDCIGDEARASGVLNADETGWRVNGKTHWLWCFTTPTLTYYVIDKSRGMQVVREFLAESFKGTLVTDFYGAYNLINEGERQFCLVHLLREFKKVSKTNDSPEWKRFAKKGKRLFRDALRLRSRREFPNFANMVNRVHLRLDALANPEDWTDSDCKRLAKRLDKTRHGLFLFLDDPAVPSDNNLAEREIRPAVIARKNSYQNTSAAGARAQAIFMTLYRTLKRRNHDPIETIVNALTIHTATNSLPKLPRPPD